MAKFQDRSEQTLLRHFCLTAVLLLMIVIMPSPVEAGPSDPVNKSQIIKRVEKREGGKVISVKPAKKPGMYRVRVLKDGGRVKTVEVAGKSARKSKNKAKK